MTRLLCLDEAAEQLGCSRTHLYALIAAGQLRPVEIKSATSTRSKTRVRDDDVEAFIQAMTRGELAGPVARAAAQGKVTHPGDSSDRQRALYTGPEAAAYAGVHVETVAAACREGRLHGTRATPRGRWRIEHPCLVAWVEKRPCEHQDGGGVDQARHGDGT